MILSLTRTGIWYLGEIVVCHDVEPGWDDWSLRYREGRKRKYAIQKYIIMEMMCEKLCIHTCKYEYFLFKPTFTFFSSIVIQINTSQHG